MKLTLKIKVNHQSQVNEHGFTEICDIENVIKSTLKSSQ